MKKLGVSAFMVVLLMLTVFPCAAVAEDLIKIGVVTPLSAPGDYKSGQINVQTVELAVEEINAKGGVLGKKLAIAKADDEGKPAVGVTAVKRVITEDKVSAIVGLWHSSVAVAQAKQVVKYGVPMLLHYSWTDDLTKGHSDYIFRVGPFNSEIANLLLPFLQKNYKSVAVMFETTAFGTGFAEALEKEAKSAGMTVYPIGFPAEATDLKPQLLELKAKSPAPDVLVIASVYQAMYLIPKQAFEIGLAPGTDILCSWDWPTYPDFWEAMGEKGVGVMYSTFESNKLKLSPLGEHFKAAFKKKYNYEPPIFAYFLYDEVMILVDAMKRANSSDPKKIAEALKGTNFNGTTGMINFERKDGPVWNQWMGHQLFVKKLTAFKQAGSDAAVVYP